MPGLLTNIQGLDYIIDGEASMAELNGIVISEEFYMLGSAAFIRAIADPLDDEVQELRKQYSAHVREGSEIDGEQKYPKAAPSFFAVLSDLHGLFTIVVTAGGGYVAKKIFDEVWDVTLRSKLRKALEAVFAKNGQKKYGVSVLFRDKRTGVSILMVSVGESLQEIEQGDRQVRLVSAQAVKALTELPSPSTSAAFGAVHMYVVEGSKANELPLVYDNLQEAMMDLRKMFPGRHPQMISRADTRQQSP